MAFFLSNLCASNLSILEELKKQNIFKTMIQILQSQNLFSPEVRKEILLGLCYTLQNAD